MDKKIKTVGSFEAKTHLAELLDRARHGQSVTITKRGRPIAQLVPYREEGTVNTRKKAITGLNAVRSRVKGKGGIRAIINEGRKR